MDPAAAEASPGVTGTAAYLAGPHGRRPAPLRLPARRTSRTSTSGARWTSRSSGCSCERSAEGVTIVGHPAHGQRRRRRRTGPRPEPRRAARPSALRHRGHLASPTAPPCGGCARRARRFTWSTSRTTTLALDARRGAALCAAAGDHPQPHVPRRGDRHARRARAGRLGMARPYVVGTVHSSRVRSAEDRALLRRLTPSMDRLIAVSRAIVAKLGARRPHRRAGRADLQRRRPQALRVHRGVLHAARGVRLPRGRAARRGRRAARAGEGPRDAARGMAARARARCPRRGC